MADLEGGGGPVDARFARSFARQVVLHAQHVESAADRARRDEIWKKERARLWFLVLEILRFPLRMILVIQTGLAYASMFHATLIGLYVGLMVSPGLLASMATCPKQTCEQRHTCSADWPWDNQFGAWCVELTELAADHAHRTWEWLSTGRTDVGGCWAHPPLEPPDKFTTPWVQLLTYVWDLFVSLGDAMMMMGPVIPPLAKSWSSEISIYTREPLPTTSMRCAVSQCKPLAAKLIDVLYSASNNTQIGCHCIWELWTS